MKTCSKCNIEKDLTEFYFRKNIQAYNSQCFSCVSDRTKKYFIENKERFKNYSIANRDKILRTKKEYYKTNKELIKKKQKIYRDSNKEKTNARRLYRKRNDPAFKLRHLIGDAVRTALLRSGLTKKSSVWKCLNYTPEELKAWLESQFKPWMSWKNYGRAEIGMRRWNIDHIIPQSRLLYTSMEEENFKKCWALENLRPMEAIANIRKGSNVQSIL